MKKHLALLVLHEGGPSAEVGGLHLKRGLLAHELDPSHELLEIVVKEDVHAILEEFDQHASRGVFEATGRLAVGSHERVEQLREEGLQRILAGGHQPLDHVVDRTQVVLLDVLVRCVNYTVVEALQDSLSCLKPLSRRQSLLVTEHGAQDLEDLTERLALLEVCAETRDDLRSKVDQEVGNIRPKYLMVLTLLLVPS